MGRGRKKALLRAREHGRCCAVACLVWSGWSASLFGQPGGWTTWETSHAIWCGQQDRWSWVYDTDSMPVHRLQSPESGRQILWGCPTDSAWSSGAWAADVLWEQDVSGSNANRSSVLWAAPPSDNPGEAAWLLATATEAGWLDNSGGVAAGETGSTDPLRLHGPGMMPWSLDPTCHRWGEPFMYRASWSFNDTGAWRVEAQHPIGTAQTWVDTLTGDTPGRPPCLGIDVTHTSSNGQRWAFGWTPLLEPADLSTDRTWHLLDSSAVEMMEWPVLPDLPPLEIRLPCSSATSPPPFVQNHACDNVFRWTLPCPVEAGGTVWLQFGNEHLALWRDGTRLMEEGDLAFTEIMADPTPAMHAPESTYLEVLNVSELALDPEQLTLEDSGNLHALEWINPPRQGLILPGERFVIADASLPWVEAALEGVSVVRALGWSGLRDEGERVSLRGPMGVLETLTYFRSWWKEASQDGVALSCQSPVACDHTSTWHPDPEGASPGRPSLLEVGVNDVASQAWRVELERTPYGTVAIHPLPAWDPQYSPSAFVAWEDSVTALNLEATWTSEGELRWELPWPHPLARSAHLTCSDFRLCAHPGQPHQLDTLWAGHRTPALGDVQLTEILPASHPVVQAEFVEWTNLSTDTLAWRGKAWSPGQSLVVSSRPRADYRPWLGTAWWADSLSCLWDVEESLALSNALGLVELRDAWGNVVAESHYSRCGHGDDLGEQHGRSMECLPQKIALGEEGAFHTGRTWRSEPSAKGMSPGLAATWSDSTHHGSMSPAHGVWNGRWITTVPSGAHLGLWRSDLWDPQTEWQRQWYEGVLLAVASWGPDSLPRGPRHRQNPELSFPEISPAEESSSFAPHWNEILQKPREGHGAFVELLLHDSGSWTTEWTWTSDPWALAEECTHLSEMAWWIPSETETCFASCPTWVEHGTHRCLPANVPSLHGEPVMTLWTPNHEVQLDLESIPEAAWAAHGEGLSLARIPGSSLWSTTPPHAEATPGQPNGPNIPSAYHESSKFSCHPSTIQPGGSWAWDTVELRWQQESAGDVFELEYGVIQPNLVRPMQHHQSTWSGAGLSWTWRGTDPQGNLQPPGTYVGVVSWRNVTRGTRGTDRCLIALAPP